VARMTSPSADSELANARERKVFLRPRDDRGTGAWALVHSVGTAKYDFQTVGEAGLVALIPCTGGRLPLQRFFVLARVRVGAEALAVLCSPVATSAEVLAHGRSRRE
jgi:hypothetical protein